MDIHGGKQFVVVFSFEENKNEQSGYCLLQPVLVALVGEDFGCCFKHK